VKVKLSNGVWYRVFTGHFEDREQAERFKQEHGLTKAIVNETKFANLITSYSSLDEIENQIRVLRNLGYCPYVMEDDGKSGRLFVGAFLTREGAQRQYDELKSSGIKAQIVKRIRGSKANMEGKTAGFRPSKNSRGRMNPMATTMGSKVTAGKQ
jgi:hypothetical protein